MEQLKHYRDVYTVVELIDYGKAPFANSKLYFDAERACTLTNSVVGIISEDAEVVEEVMPLVNTLLNDGIAPQTCDEGVFCTADELQRFGLGSGIVVAVQNDLVVLYCGTAEIDDEEFYNYPSAEEPCYTCCDDCQCCEMGDIEAQCEENDIPFINIDEMVDAFVEQMRQESKSCVCPQERKEENRMNNLFGNLGFGKLTNNRFKISMNGIAVAQDNGKYVVYNKDNNEFVDVSGMLIDIKDALFSLPAVEVNVGDTVIHEDKAYFIVSTANNEIKAVSYADCTQTVLIPKSTMFGIKYFTKVFSLFGDNFASNGDLFANPMMLMALMEGKSSDLTQLMLMNSLGNGELGANPMALALLLKDGKSEDSLSTIALMSLFQGGMNPFTLKKKETRKNTTPTEKADKN